MVSSASLLLFALVQATPAATAVVLLTSVGQAGDADRRELDAALRQAIEAEKGFSLLSVAETRDQLSSLADLGLICLPDDTNCFVKLGLAASVELVLVPVAEPGSGGKLSIEVGVIDVAASSQARRVTASAAAADLDAIARLAREALGVEDAGGPPPPAEGEGEGEGEGDKPPPPPPPPADAPPVGLIVTGVGGALAGLSIVGAVVCDLIYADVIDVADAKSRREFYQPLGAVLWISSAVGAGVLGSGVALMLTAEEPAKE